MITWQTTAELRQSISRGGARIRRQREVGEGMLQHCCNHSLSSSPLFFLALLPFCQLSRFCVFLCPLLWLTGPLLLPLKFGLTLLLFSLLFSQLFLLLGQSLLRVCVCVCVCVYVCVYVCVCVCERERERERERGERVCMHTHNSRDRHASEGLSLGAYTRLNLLRTMGCLCKPWTAH